MNNYLKIEIPILNSEQSEIMIAELSEIKFHGFEEAENFLYAYIDEKLFNESELNSIITVSNLTYKKSLIEETNWNEIWESDFQPIIIENFVVVRAAFHKSVYSVKHEIVITPKMSFGTGHHATTYLMLQQMELENFAGKSVLDFGTGTGILAILAKKSGAAKVLAIDNDEWSINNAEENIANNDCADIELYHKDNLIGLEKFDIILANINLNVITKNINQLKQVSNSTSKLFLSGFLSEDEEGLKNKFLAEGFLYRNTVIKNNWVVMLLTISYLPVLQ